MLFSVGVSCDSVRVFYNFVRVFCDSVGALADQQERYCDYAGVFGDHMDHSPWSLLVQRAVGLVH